MKELKLRAWHKKEKKMCAVKVLTFGEGAFLVGVEKGPDFTGEKYYIGAPTEGRFCHNDEFELIEFTGLFDKNGVEIYEKDIVKYDNDKPQVVEYRDCCFGFYLKHNKRMLRLYIIGDKNKYEVIGNIYSNPELL